MAFEDNELTPQEKQAILLSSLFCEPPHDLMEATRQANVFLNGGKTFEEGEASAPIRLYSFSTDASLIFAAFRQTHGINLQSAKLHWFEFLALFMDLGSETTFCQLVSLRKRIKTGRATREERAAAREMGEAFEVPDVDTRTLDEKEREAEFMRLIGK